jgi:hypothetical protein
VRAEGAAVRELLESTFADQPDLRFRGRRRYVGDDFVVSEWTASATDAHLRRIEWDGIDVFPFRDGLTTRKDVYSAAHAPRALERSSHRRERQTLGSTRLGPFRSSRRAGAAIRRLRYGETVASSRIH